MKVAILSLVGIILFLAFSITIQIYLSKSTDMLDKKLKIIESELYLKKWANANNGLIKAKKNWTHIKPIWSLFLHHEEIDAIDEALTRTVKAVKTKSFVDSQIEMGTLRQYLGHIPGRESLNLVNIL